MPFDGLLVRANEVSTDESQVTGESNLLKKLIPETFEPKEKRIPFLISGSKVMEGTGDAVVLAVGVNS